MKNGTLLGKETDEILYQCARHVIICESCSEHLNQEMFKYTNILFDSTKLEEEP